MAGWMPLSEAWRRDRYRERNRIDQQKKRERYRSGGCQECGKTRHLTFSLCEMCLVNNRDRVNRVYWNQQLKKQRKGKAA
jgi:hypothetical protein